MFPAGAGMNREQWLGQFENYYVPRGCGDEPFSKILIASFSPMFPAGAGMNRFEVVFLCNIGYVPRGCGDEPHLSGWLMPMYRCSPRVRG